MACETVPARPSLATIAMVFARVSLSSFGGGNSAWMRRELVERLGWLSDEAFMAGFAMCQILPGATTVNLSIFLGTSLRGAAGAVAAGLGIVLPPMTIVLALAAAYFAFGQVPAVQHVLAGMCAAAIGLTLQMGLSSARRSFHGWIDWAIALAVLVAIGWLRWPLVQVMAAVVPLSVGLALYRNRSRW